MFKLRKIVGVGVLALVPLFSIQADHHKRPCNENKHCKSVFRMKDLIGTYIASGITAGGPGPDASASVFTLKILDREGNGVIPGLSIRVFTGTLPSTLTRYTNLPVKVTLNPDGTGQMLIFNFPGTGDTTFFDMVVKKANQQGGVIKGILLKTLVEGPDAATSPTSNEIKLFEFERQVDSCAERKLRD